MHVFLFQLWFSLGICAGVELLGQMVLLFFIFLKEPPYFSPQWLYQFTFPPTVQEGSLLFTPSPAFTVCGFCDGGLKDPFCMKCIE